jgi:hypothetical protein
MIGRFASISANSVRVEPPATEQVMMSRQTVDQSRQFSRAQMDEWLKGRGVMLMGANWTKTRWPIGDFPQCSHITLGQ